MCAIALAFRLAVSRAVLSGASRSEEPRPTESMSVAAIATMRVAAGSDPTVRELQKTISTSRGGGPQSDAHTI